MSNHFRVNLITHFYCFECGHQLTIAYKNDKDAPVKIADKDKTPSSAHNQFNKILINPCEVCIEKHTKPAKKLANALCEIMSQAAEGE